MFCCRGFRDHEGNLTPVHWFVNKSFPTISKKWSNKYIVATTHCDPLSRYIFALRLLFVIIFEHFVFGVCKLIDFGVPDIPESLDIKVGNKGLKYVS